MENNFPFQEALPKDLLFREDICELSVHMWPSISIPFGTQSVLVYTYTLMIGVGLCHLFIGVDAASRRTGMPREESGRYLYCLGIASAGGWFVSSLTTRWLYAGNAPWGTTAALPGLIGGFLILCLCVKLFRVRLKMYLGLTVPYICYMHAWGRLGCFLGGCCHGAPTDLFLGIQFPPESRACQVHGDVPVHPTQLYEMCLLIGLGVATQIRTTQSHRITVYLIGYGLGRFCIEFLRGDDRGTLAIIPGVSPSQHMAMLFVIAGAAWWFQHNRIIKQQCGKV